MKKHLILAALVATGTICPSLGQASETNTVKELEARVMELESKMEKLFDILGNSAGVLKAPLDQAEAPFLRRGATLKAYRVDSTNYSTIQQGRTLAALTDNEPQFKLSNYLKNAALMKANNTQSVGLKWEGFLKLEKAGWYTFHSHHKEAFGEDSALKFSLSGREMASLFVDSLKVVDIELQPGYHEVEIWLSPKSGSSDGDHNLASAAVEYMLKGDEVMTKVTPKTLWHLVPPENE